MKDLLAALDRRAWGSYAFPHACPFCGAVAVEGHTQAADDEPCPLGAHRDDLVALLMVDELFERMATAKENPAGVMGWERIRDRVHTVVTAGAQT
jgi:hypothetical protein